MKVVYSSALQIAVRVAPCLKLCREMGELFLFDILNKNVLNLLKCRKKIYKIYTKIVFQCLSINTDSFLSHNNVKLGK